MQTATPSSANRQNELEKLRQRLLRLILKNEARRRITTK
jgi:DNA-binding TFAR19-related protein (PDSD5 family)